MGADRGELREVPLQRPEAGAALVRTLATAVSRGTERLVHRGGVPASEHQRMRAPHQAGDFPFPVKYGYANVGVVEDGPDDLAGRTVFCLYPHQDAYVVPSTDLTPVPEGVPPRRASLAANLETAINVVWDAGVSVGDRVSVVGGGVVGMLVAWVARGIRGTEVTIHDTLASREGVARVLGIDFRLAGAAGAGPGDADVVVHASGSADGLATAVGLAGDEAVIVEASWYGDRAVEVPLGGPFHARRLTLRASQVGRVPPARAPRWTTGRRLALALRLAAADELDVLLTSDDPFDRIVEALPARLEDPETLCATFRY